MGHGCDAANWRCPSRRARTGLAAQENYALGGYESLGLYPGFRNLHLDAARLFQTKDILACRRDGYLGYTDPENARHQSESEGRARLHAITSVSQAMTLEYCPVTLRSGKAVTRPCGYLA